MLSNRQKQYIIKETRRHLFESLRKIKGVKEMCWEYEPSVIKIRWKHGTKEYHVAVTAEKRSVYIEGYVQRDEIVYYLSPFQYTFDSRNMDKIWLSLRLLPREMDELLTTKKLIEENE